MRRNMKTHRLNSHQSLRPQRALRPVQVQVHRAKSEGCQGWGASVPQESMGNTASVSPNESDAAKKDKQATAQQRRKDNMTKTTPAPQAQRSRRSDSIASTPKIVDVGAKVPENAKASKVAPTLQTTEVVPSKAIGSQDQAPTAESVSKGDKPKADGGSDLLDVQDDSELLQRRKSQEKKEDQRQRNISGNRQREKEVALGSSEETRRRKGTREETASEQTASGSSASESYTSSSCSGSSGSQDSDGDSSDGTFYVPVSPIRVTVIDLAFELSQIRCSDHCCCDAAWH